MEFLILLILVIAMILLIRVTNKFDKVNTQLEQSNRMVDGLSHMLKKLQGDIDSLKGKEISSTPTTAEQEVEREVVSSPIPIEHPVETIRPPVEEEVMIPEPIQTVVEPKEEILPPPIPTMADRVYQVADEVHPKVYAVVREQEDSKFVKALKELNWLNAIGVITLVLGIGFFVKYAIDQDWINEIGRVALGVAVGGIVAGIAHKLSTKYHVFSSILMGGSLAILYTTITLAFREYQLFNQTVTFIILSVITVLAVCLSIAYKRQELAIFAFIGGMLAPLLISTGNGNHLVLFSYIFLLNTGVLIVAVRQRWLLVDKFSYVLTYLYLIAWIVLKVNKEYQADAIFFTSLFFLQFMVLLVLRYIKNSKEKSDVGQLLYITVVNFTSLICFFMIQANSMGTNYLGVIIVGMALINALFIVLTTRAKTAPIDKNFTYTLLAITIGLVSLAIPVQLSKVYITIVWAVEMSVLFWIWTRSKANLFRIGSIVLGVLTLVSYLIDIRSFNPTLIYDIEQDKNSIVDILPIVINQYTLTGIVILLSFFFIYYITGKKPVVEEDTIGLKSMQQPTSAEIHKVLTSLLLVLAYGIGFLEISYQVGARIEYPNLGVTDGIYKFPFSLVTYTVVYAAVYLIFYKKKMTKLFYSINLAVSGILLLLFAIAVSSLRKDIFYFGEYSPAYFTLHLVAIGAFAYFYFRLYNNIQLLSVESYKWVHALLFASLVLLSSVELDNLVVWMVSTEEMYKAVLSDVHAYGYPILWGLMAMLLMIIGMNKEKAELRKLSLISFGIIILKFYLYDVWRMNQGGKIASFVVLGVILLVVSFLLERIKLLLKDKEEQHREQ
ncbi:putative membrane protein [Myroides gitamensis]|nr:putative membrane protein [Myroides gitamensis]